MKTEWQIYWKELRRSLKGYLLAISVSLVFYLFAIPRLHGAEQHIKYLLLSMMYGTVIFTWIWCLYSAQWAIMVRQHIQSERPLRISWPTHIFLSFAGTAFGLLSALYLDSVITGDPFALAQFWESLLVGLFIATMFQFYYAYKHSSQENSKLKAAKVEADLHVLQNQMKPHFLFNSLNSLAALIDQSPVRAGDATQKLADLYRLILECSKNQLSPLRKEFQIAELYLGIEKIRFGDRLIFTSVELPKEYENVLVPSLIVQTLVENAVKHGISKSVEGGFVKLNTCKTTGCLRVEVLNSGAPFSYTDNGGTGLKNTKERLDLIFGSKHIFAIVGDSQGYTSASFLIPGV